MNQQSRVIELTLPDRVRARLTKEPLPLTYLKN
jgi:hypothetical protein